MAPNQIELPTGLWHLIANNLNRSQIKSFLGVSKIHRQIATKILFSNLKVFFGVPGLSGDRLAGNVENASAMHRATMNEAWEILGAIRSNPSFARIIRKLTIHAFRLDESELGVFCRETLCEALAVLPHLVSFTWISDFHVLPAKTVDTLVTYCQDLQEFSVPLKCLPHSDFNVLVFKNMRSLAIPAREWLTAGRLLPRLERIAVPENLTSLSLSASILWQLPLRVFANLLDLEITSGKDFHNLQLFFHHTTRLQSLTFINIDDDEVFEFLEENSTALPQLISLKITGQEHNNFPVHCFYQLSRFIETKVFLRRLDVHLYCYGIKPLLEILDRLPSLQILGLTFGVISLSAGDYTSLANSIPATVTALRLSAGFYITAKRRQEVHIHMLDRFDKLSFLHLLNHEILSKPSVEDLALKFQKVSILGIDDNLTYIDRITHCSESGDGDNFDIDIMTTPWPRRRIHARTVEDFGGCKDYEWLLRNHELKAQE